MPPVPADIPGSVSPGKLPLARVAGNGRIFQCWRPDACPWGKHPDSSWPAFEHSAFGQELEQIKAFICPTAPATVLETSGHQLSLLGTAPLRTFISLLLHSRSLSCTALLIYTCNGCSEFVANK